MQKTAVQAINPADFSGAEIAPILQIIAESDPWNPYIPGGSSVTSVVIGSLPGLLQTRAARFFRADSNRCGHRDCLVAITLALNPLRR